MMQNDMNTKAALWRSIGDRVAAMQEAVRQKDADRLRDLRHELYTLQDSLETVSKVEAAKAAAA